MTGVATHVSMSEKSRMETLEKTVAQHQRWLGDLVKVIKELEAGISSHEDWMQEISNSLGACENEISALNERVSIEPEPHEAGSEGEDK